MKKEIFWTALALSLLLAACKAPAQASTENGTIPQTETETKARAVYDCGFADELRGDPQCGGYRYTNGTATYIILQRGNDVRVEFESTVRPDMNMCAARIGGKTVYVKGGAVFEDTENRYPLPIDQSTAASDWLFDELRTYGSFAYAGEQMIDGEACDLLTASKTEKSEGSPALDYDMYAVSFTYQDGIAYEATFFDCSDPSLNLLSGELPPAFGTGVDWTVDLETATVCNTATGESCAADIRFLETRHIDASAPSETVTEARVCVSRQTGRIERITIQDAEETRDYMMQYPESVEAIDVDGLPVMDDETIQYVTAMIALIMQSL
ncbi:MAG: hypothetical protein II405_06405 [Oscillospiraceae bacterium]|nr:hypothetical protein [Oscillospiraceae bacterium]